MINFARLTFILPMLWFSTLAFAQQAAGIVKDAKTRWPIVNAQIITSKSTVLTSKAGTFSLAGLKLGDYFSVRIMGYETAEFKIDKLTDTLRIYLKQEAITLQEVMIKGKRNYTLDSLNLRKEYAAAFAYKGPGFTDMFIARDPNYDSPFPFSNPKSTASLVSLNVLQVFSLLGKKKNPTNRLKETLLRDEELNYVDHLFSKDKVKSITGLDGEELIKFMDVYRPSILALKKMTGYELTIYIKKSHQEFVKSKT